LTVNNDLKRKPSEVSKSFADIRIKQSDRKRQELLENNSIPSDISDDEWGEVVKYEHEKY
jgi:hypothetical protein